MANSLLDAIKQNKQNVSKPLGVTGLGFTNTINQTIQAKSGKTGTNQGLGQTGSLGEEQGLEQANLQMANLNDQANASNAQIGLQEEEQTQKFEQGKQSLVQESAAQKQNLRIKSMQLLDQLELAQNDLNTKQKIAGLEQAGFLLAQQDKDYMNQLEMEGKKRRLDDEANFRLELQKTTLGDMYDLFQDDLAFKGMFNANEREFTRQLAQIDINTAINIGRAQIQESNTQAIFTGVGGLASAGAKIYDKKTQSDDNWDGETID
jgi:hypothetical protein